MGSKASAKGKNSSAQRRNQAQATRQQMAQRMGGIDPTELQRRMGNQGAAQYLQAMMESQSAVQSKPADSPAVQQSASPEPPVQKQNEETTPVQAKLTVGRPSDQYEREADAAAANVMADKPVQRISEIPAGGLPQALEVQRETDAPEESSLQRKTDSEYPLQTAPAGPLRQSQRGASQATANATSNPKLQRQEDPAADVQTKPAGPKRQSERGRSQSDANLEKRVQMPVGGRPMSPTMQESMGEKFSTDFSHVRVHDDSQAKADAASLGAKAFTAGSDIWLGSKASSNDKALMAHELTHVVQQKSAVQETPIQKTSDESMAVQAQADSEEEEGGIKGWVLGKLKGFVQNLPGYYLFSVIIGRDPITKEPVERTGANLIRGAMGLLPGGEVLYQNLNATGAVDRAGAWLDAQIDTLNLTWAGIKAMFAEAWDAISVWSPRESYRRVKAVFTEPVQRIKTFVGAIGNKILEFVLHGALSLAGGAGEKVMALLKGAGDVFINIIKDPIGFFKNLGSALKQGFDLFKANIGAHLQAGLAGWLFGTLAGSGLELPKTLSLKGILSLVLQILGVTWAAIRKRIVKVIGEKRMARIEKTVSFVADLVTRGPMAAWEMITGAIGNLKEMVVGAIKDWVVTKVVKSAISKLVTMFNPVGAIVQAGIAIYNTVMFFIERAQQIAALVKTITGSIGSIAAGAVGAAAKLVEMAMGRTIPVVLSFLARLLGLSGIGETVKGIVKKVQKPISKGIDAVVGWVVKKASGLIGKKDQTRGKKRPNTYKDRDRKGDDNGIKITPEVFKMSGQVHTLSYENGKVMMASSAKGWIVSKLDEAKKLVISNPDNPAWKGNFDNVVGSMEGLTNAVVSTTKKLEAAKKAVKDKTRVTSKDLREINKAKGALGMLATNISKFGDKYRLKDLTGISTVEGDYREKKITVTFRRREWHDKGEYDRQLAAQQAGINSLSIDQWQANRKKYLKRKAETGSGRDSQSRGAQERARKLLKAETIERVIEEAEARGEELSLREATKLVETKYVALHDPDQVAGGEATAIGSLGRGDINSSIGAQWPHRINTIDIMVRKMFKKIPRGNRSKVGMNVELVSKKR